MNSNFGYPLPDQPLQVTQLERPKLFRAAPLAYEDNAVEAIGLWVAKAITLAALGIILIRILYCNKQRWGSTLLPWVIHPFHLVLIPLRDGRTANAIYVL